MSGRAQPLNGADSAEAYVLRPFLVLMESRWEEGDRIKVRVRSALGVHDAKGQARTDHPEYVALRVDEVDPDEAARWAAEDRADDLAKLRDRGRRSDEPSYNAIDRVAS